MIPNIIHYCWFGGKSLPLDVKKCIKSWEKKCPGYKIKQWDEGNFNINCHPFARDAYKAKAWAFISDYARLKIIYENGGIYLDTDVELLKNLDFLRLNKFYIGVQQYGHLCTTGLGFGAVKDCPVILQMMNQYNEISFNEERKENFACPVLNNKVLEDMGYIYSNEPVKIGEFLILPPRYLDPVAPGDGLQNLLCEDTVSIHHYSASWMGRKTMLKRKIMRVIGQEHINTLKKALKNEK